MSESGFKASVHTPVTVFVLETSPRVGRTLEGSNLLAPGKRPSYIVSVGNMGLQFRRAGPAGSCSAPGQERLVSLGALGGRTLRGGGLGRLLQSLREMGDGSLPAAGER